MKTCFSFVTNFLYIDEKLYAFIVLSLVECNTNLKAKNKMEKY